MGQGQVVLVDTNIIIEAFRTRCWKALTAYYRVETVEKCYEEALTGDRLRPGYVEVDAKVLKETAFNAASMRGRTYVTH